MKSKENNNNNNKHVDRRDFLSRSAKLVAGAAIGVNLPASIAAVDLVPSGDSSTPSQVGQTSMSLVDPATLSANGVDVAGVITETFLNKFAKAHFEKGNAIYKGSYDVTDFESKLRISYEFKSPIKFALSPIRESLFKDVWISHLRNKGAAGLTDVSIVPPNLVLAAEKVKFVFTVFRGQTNQEDFSVEFEWDLEARCAVTLAEASGGGKEIRLEPLKVKFSKPVEQLAKEIIEAVQKIGNSRRRTSKATNGAFGNPADPEWCIKLERLFLFLVNQLLAVSMTNFIKTWQLPRAIDLIKGVAISPSFLEIANKMLVVGGQVIYALPRISPIAERVTEFLEGFNEKLAEEITSLTDEQLEKWEPSKSPSFQFIKMKETEILSEYNSLVSESKKTSRAYPENLQILSNDKLFDALAKAYLKDEHHGDYQIKLDFLIKAEAGWWEKVDGGYGRVVPGGIQIGANVNIGGYARACVPNPDPKHWGEWLCVGLCVQLEPKPNFGINAYPNFKNSGIHIRLVLLTQRIEMSLCGNVPGWINRIIRWLTGVLTEPLLNVIRALIALFNFKIVDYPKYFPGTALEWRPRFNTQPSNTGPYLAFTADPEFKS
jgi:hypothetical protein